MIGSNWRAGDWLDRRQKRSFLGACWGLLLLLVIGVAEMVV